METQISLKYLHDVLHLCIVDFHFDKFFCLVCLHNFKVCLTEGITIITPEPSAPSCL